MAKATTRLSPKATFVTRGYGQVEPNRLNAAFNGKVFAQLPAAADIEILENGQFVKYNYAAGVCNFSTEASSGPWMMVFNEVKVYDPREGDADFAMIKNNYNARVYSPVGQTTSELIATFGGDATVEGSNDLYKRYVEKFNYPQMMPEGTRMVPRVIGIEPGEIWTTNTIKADPGSLSVGTMLKIDTDGYLTAGTAAGGDMDPSFTVVKVYTLPDLQPGVKVQRVN